MSIYDSCPDDFIDQFSEDDQATWQPQAPGAQPVLLSYIWSPFHVEMDSGSSGAPIESWGGVAAHVRTVDVPGVLSDDLLTICGVVHRIIAVRPTVGGMTILVLQKTLAGSRP